MSQFTDVTGFVPSIMPISMDEAKIAQVMNDAKAKDTWVLCFIVGTKPCTNKFFGAITESLHKGIPVLVIDSNQHYDAQLTHGLKEFEYLNHVAVNLNIRGDLAQKSGELFFKISYLAKHLKKQWPSVVAVPVINGDVITAAIAPAAWMFSRGEKGINMEAGMRAMSPEVFTKLNSNVSIPELIEKQFHGDWRLLTNEPYPEQWDTYVSSKGCQYNFAPLEINRQHLLREGYNDKHVFVHGAVVIDAWKFLESKKEKPRQSIFDIYPQLAQGEWIRADIHRKENLTERRFKAIFGGIKKLTEHGHQVNFVETNASKYALDKYGLRAELDKLKEKKNFLYTPVWPEFSHVMEFYRSKHNLVPLSDSGGLQEDMNYWRKPCLTLRLSTDRPESVMTSHSNLLVAPISADHVFEMTHHVATNSALMHSMANGKYIYGDGFGKSFASTMSGLFKTDYPFAWSQDDLGLWHERSNPDF